MNRPHHGAQVKASRSATQRITRRNSTHVGVLPVLGRDEGLLDRAGGGPAEEVDGGAGLVVGTRRTSAAEGLLADDGAGGLVVDVEVAGGEAQGVLGPGDGLAVLGDDRTGEGV